MNIILWRHAEAEYGPPDLERQLTEKGRQQAAAMARWLQTYLREPYTLLASQAARSQQTAAYLADVHTVSSQINPETDTAALLRLLSSFNRSEKTVILVGHQPWLGELCAFLLNSSWNNSHYWSVKKGGVWWFQVKNNNGNFSAKLKAAMTPAMLIQDTD